jgi:hypothetical protein
VNHQQAGLEPPTWQRGEQQVRRLTRGRGGATFYFWILDLIFILDFYLRTQYSSTYGRPITYQMGGSLVEVHSSSYFCLSHARTIFSCGAPCCNPAHRDGMGSGG